MLKPFISQVIKGIDLSFEEAETAMSIIMRGDATQAQIGGYLVALRMKGETVAEIGGSAAAMRSVVNHVVIPTGADGLLDTAGTGGDGTHSFNISTAAAFVIAGAGRQVAKHGNRAASSRCGSADVLAALGVEINLTPEQVGDCIREAGIGFMFAPKFHPAMKHAIGPRVELGQRTIFNILGPLTNPAGATYQLLGVFDPALTEPMARVLGDLGGVAAFVVHGAGGLDELTTSGPNRVSRLSRGEVETFDLDPRGHGLRPAAPHDLAGGEPEENAGIMRDLLTGRIDSPLADVVILNAGAALSLYSGDLAGGIEQARESLASGAAARKLDGLVAYSRMFAG
ncbi:MAG TPA: anthranilate phosphoribosyltransferase [Anaerolineales bacterium]|nr:anthranilate phosphoribosyltransferase [Anaerolineales bacterium]